MIVIMRLLVLGGTWFVGRVVAEQAVARGWDVTIFNRGRSGHAPTGTAEIHGDRENVVDLKRLAASGPWDAVVDVHGSVPTVVRDSVRALQSVVERYVFVSTISAYQAWPHEPVSEESALHPGNPDWDPGFRHWDAVAYGPLKAGCEAAIRRDLPEEQSLILRPGVVLGPYEYVGRMRWWLGRVRQGGGVLAPGDPGRTIQPVDVRDVARFLLNMTESRQSGIYNVAPPAAGATFADLLHHCIAVTKADAEVVWVDEDWLIKYSVRQWTELPLWRKGAGTWAMDTRRAREAGLRCRPLSDTVADTWSWLSQGGKPVAHERDAEHGITLHKERELLAAAVRDGAIVARTRP